VIEKQIVEIIFVQVLDRRPCANIPSLLALAFGCHHSTNGRARITSVHAGNIARNDARRRGPLQEFGGDVVTVQLGLGFSLDGAIH
jgi:hypothetical protein